MQSNSQMIDERYSMRLCLKDLGHDEIFINGYMIDIYHDNDSNPMSRYSLFMNYRYGMNIPTQNIQNNMETQNTQNNMDNLELNDDTAMEYLNNNIRRNNMSRHNNNNNNNNTRVNRDTRNINNRRSRGNNNGRRRRRRRSEHEFLNYRRNSSTGDITNNTLNNESGFMYTTMSMDGSEREMVVVTSSNNYMNLENLVTMMESLLPSGFMRLSERSLMDGFQQLLQRSIGDTGAKHRDVLKNNAADELKNKNTYSYNELKMEKKDIDKESCSVCLEPIKPENDMDDSYNKKVLLKLLCGHIFHSVCVMKWLTEGDHRCPVCRTSCGNHHEIKDKDN